MDTIFTDGQLTKAIETMRQKGMTPERFNKLLGSGIFADVCDQSACLDDRNAVRTALKLGVALPEAAFGLPVTVIILRPFMRAIPSDLEDAAAIDGCSKIAFFWRILVPLSRPALTTVSVLAVVTSWNAFLLPLIVLNNPNEWTLPLGVASYQGEYAQDTAAILAYTALSMVPALLFFLAAERKIVGGLSGAIKG